MPAIWNKQFLLEFIEDNWQFDTIEMPGALKFSQENKNRWRSVGTYPAQWKSAHLIFTRDTNLVELTMLKAICSTLHPKHS